MKSIDTMLRTHFSYALSKCCRYAIPILHSTGVGGESFVFGEIVETEGARACLPLPIAPNRDDERPIRRLEQLIRDEIRMGVSPSLGVSAGNQNVLRDVHERGTRTVRQ